MTVTREDVQQQALETIEAVLKTDILTTPDKLRLIQTLAVAALREDIK